jgi:anaerobic magnesium-protoporphyrin IX monomethyl ester cyclase
MGLDIDCLLIGHNEMDFEKYEKICRKMGLNSGAYRDLNLNFIRWENKPYSTAGMFNILNRRWGPAFHIGESFSAAIAYLGSHLDRHGYQWDFVNSFQQEKKELIKKLQQNNILSIAIITTLYVFALPILEIIELVRKHNPTAKIIVGGPFVSTRVRTLEKKAVEYLFTHVIDADYFVNSSQGESALVKILQALKNNLPVEGIENIYYKVDNGYKTTGLSKENNPLAENLVNWSLFSGRIGDYVNIRTAISCPFSCSFCGFPEHAGEYQALPVEYIEKELNGLQTASPHVKDVHFVDDTFNVPHQRFKEILNILIKNQYEFKWHSYFRCQFADRETVKLMKESGCEGVFLGLESGNEQILKNMNKRVELKKYLEGIALLKEYGIVTFGNFIIGFPGETHETLRDTLEFIEKSGLDFYRAQLWYCEPITPIWRERERYKIKGEGFEWSHTTMDSRTACDLVEEIFLSIRNPICIPLYNFDFDSLWHLVHRGMTLDQVKNFLKGFNQGIKEKLPDPKQQDPGFGVIKKLYKAFGQEEYLDENPPPVQDMIRKYNAEFDY